jgi:tetratricopeptide (TPR) repeat protein
VSETESIPREYAAFITYSHADRRTVDWLHRALETYRLPGDVLAALPEDRRRSPLKPIFQDRAELSASSSLLDSVKSALDRSRHLVVVCSPASIRSRWVNEEIAYFQALGRGRQISCLLVGSEPTVTNAAQLFPPALLAPDGAMEGTHEPANEPLAADIRAGQDSRRDAVTKIVAHMLGVDFDTLRRREQTRRQRQLVGIAAAAVAASVVFATLAIVAVFARNEAREQRALAEQTAQTARQTAEFLRSLFQVVDPGEARGNSITAREILDRGADTIERRLRSEPAVRLELTTTLGQVYSGLGLYQRAEAMLLSVADLSGTRASAALERDLALADVRVLIGNYSQACPSYEMMLARAEASATALRARAMLGLSECSARQGDDKAKAVRFADEALAAAQAVQAPDGGSELIARSHEQRGFALFANSDFDGASRAYETALAVRTEASGPWHPRAIESVDALGAIAYMRGDRLRAKAYFEKALDAYVAVLGDRHPSVGIALNNLARVELETRAFRSAQTHLAKSRDVSLSQRSEQHDDLAFVFSNLALAHVGLGDDAAAEPLFHKARVAAAANKHRTYAPILTDLAALECRTGRQAAGLQRLAEAEPIMRERYPQDAWRSAWVQSTRGACHVAAGDLATAEPLLTQSLTAIQAKWPADTMYGHEAIERMANLYSRLGDAQAVDRYRQQLSGARSPGR